MIGDREVNSRTSPRQNNMRAPFAKTPTGLLENFDGFRTGNVGGQFGHLSDGDLERFGGRTFAGADSGVLVHNRKDIANSGLNVRAGFREGPSLADAAWEGGTFGNVPRYF